MKVDVQGAEVQVLNGASRTLQTTEAVILEVTLFGTMIGGPQLYDVVSRMNELGFVVYDVYGFLYRPSTMRSANWTWFSCASMVLSARLTFTPRPNSAPHTPML